MIRTLLQSRVVTGSCILLVTFLGTLQGAEAWVSTKQWASTNTGYDRSSMNSSWQSAVGYGAAGWNFISGSSWYYWVGSSSPNKVRTGWIDGADNTLATNAATVSGGNTITGFNMTYDTGENWYLGTGTPGSNQVDARSVTRHEFGHSLGLSHSDAYCSNNYRPTMCSGYIKGTTYKRSLEPDDRNGLMSLYPG